MDAIIASIVGIYIIKASNVMLNIVIPKILNVIVIVEMKIIINDVKKKFLTSSFSDVFCI